MNPDDVLIGNLHKENIRLTKELAEARENLGKLSHLYNRYNDIIDRVLGPNSAYRVPLANSKVPQGGPWDIPIQDNACVMDEATVDMKLARERLDHFRVAIEKDPTTHQRMICFVNTEGDGNSYVLSEALWRHWRGHPELIDSVARTVAAEIVGVEQCEVTP